MNVYKIDGYFIAAEKAEEAFGVYMEETNSMDSHFIDEPDEGESEDVTVSIKRLTQKEILAKSMECHGLYDDRCKYCEDKDDYIYISMQDIINTLKEDSFPCVIAKEE